MKTSALVVMALIVSGSGFVVAEETAQKAQAAPAAAAAVKIEKIAVGTAIDNKEISGESSQFDNSVTRLYCWTKVSADQTPATIKHVWSADGKKEAEVSLDIKYPSSRTWSSKTVWPGSWKVDVTDDQGKVLASKEFTVAKVAAPPAKSAQPAQVGQ